MTFGTVYNRNFLHRLGDAVAAFTKGLPTPAQLYPSQQNVSGGFLTFPGWEIVEQQANGKDEARVKIAEFWKR